MDKDNKEVVSSKQFKWTKPMEIASLESLAEEARKPYNLTFPFRSATLNRVASIITEKFNVQCDHTHIENHIKAVKNRWMVIHKLQEYNKFGWDENLKMVTCDQSTYNECVMANPRYGLYLNRKLEYYDEMAIIVSSDDVEGRFAKTFANIKPASINESQEVDIDSLHKNDEKMKGKASSSNVAPSQKFDRKRKSDNTMLEQLVVKLGDIAKAIEKLRDADKFTTKELYKQVMSIRGFGEEDLCKIFEYLMKNEVEAKIFMAKSYHLKKSWVEKFHNI